jgi:replication-associated recombination protein RarA
MCELSARILAIIHIRPWWYPYGADWDAGTGKAPGALSAALLCVGFVHEFKPFSQTDVWQLLRVRSSPSAVSLPHEDLIDEEAIAMLSRIMQGRFRLLHRVLTQIGRVMEINGLDKLTREVVEAAGERLVVPAV